jgi:soluble lytic murein transglycosylase-like protein/TolA-binding protein
MAGTLIVSASPEDAPGPAEAVEDSSSWAERARETLLEAAAMEGAEAARALAGLREANPALFSANRLPLAEAAHLERAGRLEEALSLYEAYPADDPLAPHAHYRALLVLDELGRAEPKARTRALERAVFEYLEKNPRGLFRNEAALLLVRRLAAPEDLPPGAGRQRKKKSVDSLERLLRFRPLSRTVRREIGYGILRLRVARDSHKEAASRLLRFLRERDSDDWALRAAREFVKSFPGAKKAHPEELTWLLAKVFYNNREFEEAENRLAAFVEKHPRSRNRSEALFLRGRALVQQKSFTEAHAVFEELATSKEWAARAAYQKALILEREGLFPEAVRTLSEALKRFPRSSKRDSLHAKLVILHRRAGEEEKARQVLKEIRPGGENRLWERLLFERGVELSLSEDPGEENGESASAPFEEVLRRTPLASYKEEAAFRLGLLAERDGDEDEARRRYVRVLDANPSGYFADFIVRESSCLWAGGDEKGSESFALARSLREAPVPTLSASPSTAEADRMLALLSDLSDKSEIPLDGAPERARYLTALGLSEWGAHELRHHLRTGRPVTLADLRDAALCAREAGDYRLLVRLAGRAASGEPPEARAGLLLRRALYPLPYWEFLRSIACRDGVDPYLVAAVMREESRFDPRAKSWAAARGLMQFIPSTARHYAALLDIPFENEDALYDPQTAIRLGARYLADLLEMFDGNFSHAVAAYNAGEHRVEEWRESLRSDDPAEFLARIPYLQTRNYVKRVLNSYGHYRSTYGGSPCGP